MKWNKIGLNMELDNPFLLEGYYTPEYFCDREKETETIIDALHNGRNMTLIAPRRMGKTGLIHNAFYRLRERQTDIVTLYMDIFATQSLGDFVRLFASTALGKLDSAPQKAYNRVLQFIRSCRPIFTFDEVTGAPKVMIDVSHAEEESTLKEIFDYLASSEKRCYIAIDEFQQIAEYPGKGVEALLRSYIQFVPNVNFIYSGSKQHLMAEMFASAKRPFYQSAQFLSLGAINREEYADFAMNYFAKHGTQLPREVFDAIYDKFDGITWYVQCLLNRLYGYNRDADMELLAQVSERVVAERSQIFANILKAYTPGHVRLLKAIAREGCVKSVLSGSFIAKHGLTAASSVSAALKKLLDNELVYQSDNGYIIYDRLMNEWLRSLAF